MGCVPPQKRQQPAAANAAIRKYPSQKKNESVKSKNSSNSTQNQVKGVIERVSNQSSKTSRKNIQVSSPQKGRGQGANAQKRLAASNKQTSFERRLDRQALQATTPRADTIQLLRLDEASKIMTVNSLDIHSRIKQSGEGEREVKRKQGLVQREEDINITFNNNNFAMANQRNNGVGMGNAVSMGKRWREETLREELRGMNDQNFRKINIEFMNFN